MILCCCPGAGGLVLSFTVILAVFSSSIIKHGLGPSSRPGVGLEMKPVSGQVIKVSFTPRPFLLPLDGPG